MKFSEFLAFLQKNKGQELVFEFEHGQIRKDYHITEIFNSKIQAIDCGGNVESWAESVFQLIEPSNKDGERFMSVQKALGIIEKSAKLIDLATDGKVILEYRPVGAIAAQRYAVSKILSENGKLLVHSSGATTQCKPAAKSQSVDSKSSACCPTASKKGKSTSACCG